MKSLFYFLIIFGLAACNTSKSSIDSNSTFAQNKAFSLAQPKFRVDQTLFDQSATFTLELDHEGTELFYTIDGSEPTRKSRKYVGRVSVYESTKVKARAFHKEFNPSPIIEQELFKIAPAMNEVKAIWLTDANEKYPGTGSISLTDRELGTMNFSTGNAWTGFTEKEVFIHLISNQKTEAKNLCLRVLENHAAWIFAPIKIELYADGECVASESFTLPDQEQTASAKFLSVELPETHHKLYSVKIISADTIPDWHQGAGTKPWLFVDELFLY